MATALGRTVEGLPLIGRLLKNSAGVPVEVVVSSRSQVRSTVQTRSSPSVFNVQSSFATGSPAPSVRVTPRSVTPLAVCSTDSGARLRLSKRRPVSSTAKVRAWVAHPGIERIHGTPLGESSECGSSVPSARRRTSDSNTGRTGLISTRPNSPSRRIDAGSGSAWNSTASANSP